MKRVLAAVGVASALLAAPAVASAQSHHGGGGYRGGGGGSTAGSGGLHESGSGYRGGGGYGYRGGGYRGGGYGRGYGYRGGFGYRGYGYFPAYGFAFGLGFGGLYDPWFGGYPYFYGSPWYYDYVSGGPYPPPGAFNDPYGYYPGPSAGASAGYDRDEGRGGAWDRDYGSASSQGGGAPCGQWVWNAGGNKYDWQAGACAPAATQPRGVDAPPLRVPPQPT